MKLPFLHKNTTTDPRSSPPWPWPSCTHPRTLSFRANVFKTINSAYLDAPPPETHTPESWFTNSSDSASFSTASTAEDATETVIRGLRSSERLFFEPGETSSILAAEQDVETAPFKESLAMSVESRDPFADFRRSMEEMVEAHRLRDWNNLEELLSCYLRVNGKHNHDYIIGAFVDLLVNLAITAPPPNRNAETNCASSSTNSHRPDSPSSPLSLCTSSCSSSTTTTITSPCVSSSLEIDDNTETREIEEDEHDICLGV